MLDSIPRERFAFLPTPLHAIANLATNTGLTSLWIKRDDLTGISIGGNKTRKLEYIIAEAKAEGTNTLMTVGAVQSNHCRQVAAVAAMSNMRCILLLSGEEPMTYTGNLLLAKLYGAEIKFFENDDLFSLNNRMAIIMDTLTELGLKPFSIPAGGAMPSGVIAYANAMFELKKQCDNLGLRPNKIIVASGTGGTQSGLILGAHMLGWDIDIIGIAVVDNRERTAERINGLIDRTFDRYPFLDRFTPKVNVDDRFLGEGYGKMYDGVKDAIKMFAQMEGIILDPVYTGKAGFALIKMAVDRELDHNDNVIFWHTGGFPTIFTHSEDIF